VSPSKTVLNAGLLEKNWHVEITYGIHLFH
jgi:hypothetical protein